MAKPRSIHLLTNPKNPWIGTPKYKYPSTPRKHSENANFHHRRVLLMKRKILKSCKLIVLLQFTFLNMANQSKVVVQLQYILLQTFIYGSFCNTDHDYMCQRFYD